MTLFLILLIVLVAAPTVSWAWKHKRPQVQQRREAQALRSRFNRDSKLDLPDFFQVEALTLRLIEFEDNYSGSVVGVDIPKSERDWYYRQLFLTNPRLYRDTIATLDHFKKEYNTRSTEYRRDVSLHNYGHGRWLLERPQRMDTFELDYPRQAEVIRDEVHEKKRERERETIEDKKTWTVDPYGVDTIYDD